MSLLPDDDELELLHTRTYETRVYLIAEDELLVRGAVQDLKPPGLYIRDDPEELELHNMQVELRVRVPSLEIIDADLDMTTHPQPTCPAIEEHYRGLIGLNIGRGFTHEVRARFGGPRGCAHTTALLQAMAPAVVQSLWSISLREKQRHPGSTGPGSARKRMAPRNVNTCHVWDEDGEHVAMIRRGEPVGPPLQVRRRLQELGRDPDRWSGFDAD